MRPNPEETVDSVTITKEILNEKLHFLCSVYLLRKIKNIVNLRKTFFF